MNQMLFVNLPVRDLEASVSFFTRLGFEFDPKCTDETATGMIVNQQAYVMLLTESKFRSFVPHPVANANRTTEVLVALSCDSRERVDALVDEAVAAGGMKYSEPQNHGFMYQHGFRDLDGHCWELLWMDLGMVAD